MSLKLSHRQMDWIADHLIRDLDKNGALTGEVTVDDMKKSLIDAMKKNIADEVALDQEARALLQKQLGAMGPAADGIDQHKAWIMIKKQLAQKKGFVL